MKYKYLFLVLIFGLGIIFPTVSAQQWCGIKNLYFSDIDSNIPGYWQLLDYATGGYDYDENITVAAGQPPKFIDGYISPPGIPGSQLLLAGLREYNIYGYVDSTSNSSYYTFNVSVLHSNGTYTTYYNTTSVAISSVTPKIDKTPYVSSSNITFSPNDRILIQIYGYTTRVASTKIHFVNGGINTASYVQSGYFVCPDIEYQSQSGSGGEAIGLISGIIGGMIGAIIYSRKLRGKP